jgi:hypothetical protein
MLQICYQIPPEEQQNHKKSHLSKKNCPATALKKLKDEEAC